MVFSDGTFKAVLDIPAGLEAGSHEIEATGTKANGVVASARSPFVLARSATAAAPAELAFTGSTTSGMLQLAAAFLVLGLAGLVASRPRRQR